MKIPEIWLENQIDMTAIIEKLPDRERIKWVKALAHTVEEQGTIEKLREIVNNPELDD